MLYFVYSSLVTFKFIDNFKIKELPLLFNVSIIINGIIFLDSFIFSYRIYFIVKKGKRDDRIATVKKTKELYEFYSKKFYESITKFGISQNESFTFF